MAYERERETALQAVRQAGFLSREIETELIGEETLVKGDKSPVTVADYAAQAVVCRIVGDAFPGDAIVGEEDAKDLSAPENRGLLERVTSYVGRVIPGATEDEVCCWIDRGNGDAVGRFWTLDPIDGTKGFIRGDQYAVALALVEEGDVKVGLLACPNLPLSPGGGGERGAIFAAVRGEGTVMLPLEGGGEERLSVSVATGFASSRMAEGVEAAHSDHEGQSALAGSLGIVKPSVRMDSQAKYGAVARGEAEIYIRMPSPKTPDYREKIWDHAAGLLVVEEAGGRVTDIFGNRLDFTKGKRLLGNRGVLVTNGPLHDSVVRAISLPPGE